MTLCNKRILFNVVWNHILKEFSSTGKGHPILFEESSIFRGKSWPLCCVGPFPQDNQVQCKDGVQIQSFLPLNSSVGTKCLISLGSTFTWMQQAARSSRRSGLWKMCLASLVIYQWTLVPTTLYDKLQATACTTVLTLPRNFMKWEISGKPYEMCFISCQVCFIFISFLPWPFSFLPSEWFHCLPRPISILARY